MNNVTIMCKGGINTVITECDGAKVIAGLEAAILNQQSCLRIQTKNAVVLIAMSEFVFAVSEEE